MYFITLSSLLHVEWFNQTKPRFKQRCVQVYTATSCCKHFLRYVVGVASHKSFARKLIFRIGVCCVCLLKTGRIQSRWLSTKTRSTGPRLMKVKSRSASESYSESIWLFFIKHLQYYFLAKQNTSNHSINSFHKAALELIFSPYACQQWIIYLRRTCVCVGVCVLEGHKWSMPNLSEFHSVWLSSFSGMTIPEDDSEAGQTSKYCLVAIGRLQVSEGIVAAALLATSFNDPRMIGHHWDRKMIFSIGTLFNIVRCYC